MEQTLFETVATNGLDQVNFISMDISKSVSSKQLHKYELMGPMTHAILKW